MGKKYYLYNYSIHFYLIEKNNKYEDTKSIMQYLC